MSYTLKELKHKTASELKDIAKGLDHEAVKGYTQLNKDHLITAICTALNIHMHEHVEVKGVDRGALKNRIRGLKKQRDQVLSAGDRKELKKLRHSIKEARKKLRKAVA